METTDDDDQPARLPRPKHLEAQRRRSNEEEIKETPNTRANREIEEMKAKIAQAQMELDQKRDEETLQENSFTMEMDTTTPRLCSTQISSNEPHLSEDEDNETLEPVEGGFEMEHSTLVEQPQSYQQGHSVTYIGQKFDFLRSETMETSINELKEERAPDEIRRETKQVGSNCYEAETPDKLKSKKKRRSASFCISGSADDMVEFTGKSLQSFRRTQRVKRHEAKATASSVFSNVQDEMDINAERKRLKAEIDSQMNIIRFGKKYLKNI